MIAGWRKLPDSMPELQQFEDNITNLLQIQRVGPEELGSYSETVVSWLRKTGAKHVAVHFDLDVLDPSLFGSLTFTRPGAPEPTDNDIQAGRMTLPQVVSLLSDVAKHADVVGLGITEYIPWDAMALRKAFEELPLVGKGR